MTNRVLSFFEKLGKPVEKVGEIGLDIASVVPISAPVAGPLKMVVTALAARKHLAIPTGGTMNPNMLEQFAITMILGVLNTVIKNPAHKAMLQNQLLGIAADIQIEYGLTPPTMPALAASGTTAGQ